MITNINRRCQTDVDVFQTVRAFCVEYFFTIRANIKLQFVRAAVS